MLVALVHRLGSPIADDDADSRKKNAKVQVLRAMAVGRVDLNTDPQVRAMVHQGRAIVDVFAGPVDTVLKLGTVALPAGWRRCRSDRALLVRERRFDPVWWGDDIGWIVNAASMAPKF